MSIAVQEKLILKYCQYIYGTLLHKWIHLITTKILKLTKI